MVFWQNTKILFLIKILWKKSKQYNTIQGKSPKKIVCLLAVI